MTDCLTSLHYIFKQAFHLDIPLTYIGDMPRQLIQYSEWSLLKVNLDRVKPGDIIFVKNKDKPKLISHVALYLRVDCLFHCSDLFGKAVTQSNEEFFDHYEQKLKFDEMIRFIDPRNKELRNLNEGFFVKKD